MLRPRWHILDKDKNPVPVRDMLTWARWAEAEENTIVAHTMVDEEQYISTIFLGIDHRFSSPGPPLFFETMIFGGVHHKYQSRCSTYAQAIKSHALACGLVTGKVKVLRHGK